MLVVMSNKKAPLLRGGLAAEEGVKTSILIIY
jgi:hypothetical protein